MKTPWCHLNSEHDRSALEPGNGGGPAGHFLPTAYGRLPRDLRTPLTSRIVRTAGEVETVLATCVSDPGRIAPYADAGCRVWTLPGRGEHVDLPALMDALGAAEIDGVLLEGGGTLNWAMLEAGLVQRVQAYIAPKLLGGAGARSPVEGRGVEAPDQAAHLRKVTVTALGEDFLLEGEVDRDVYGTH